MNREQRRARGQRTPKQATEAKLHYLAGRELPGGCDDCNSYQIIDDREAPVFVLRVHHDDTCPTLRAMEER